jgi:hypothetical protein
MLDQKRHSRGKTVFKWWAVLWGSRVNALNAKLSLRTGSRHECMHIIMAAAKVCAEWQSDGERPRQVLVSQFFLPA